MLFWYPFKIKIPWNEMFPICEGCNMQASIPGIIPLPQVGYHPWICCTHYLYKFTILGAGVLSGARGDRKLNSYTCVFVGSGSHSNACVYASREKTRQLQEIKRNCDKTLL